MDRLGEVLRESRSAGIPRLSPGEGAVRIPSATFNHPTDLEKLLNEQVQAGRGSFLVLDDLAALKTDSPGFATLSNTSNVSAVRPLAVAGLGLRPEPSARSPTHGRAEALFHFAPDRPHDRRTGVSERGF